MTKKDFKQAVLKNLGCLFIGIFLYFYWSILIFLSTGKFFESSKLVYILDKQGTCTSCMLVYSTNILGLCVFFVALLNLCTTLVLYIVKKNKNK